MTRTEKIANEVYDRHKLAQQWPCFFYHGENEDEARIQIHSLTGDWTVTRTKDGVHYVHATVLHEEPNVSHKRWPEWLREGLAWLVPISLLGMFGLWLDRVWFAFHIFILRMASLLS